jgi:4-amino-4-deoxy-L-arabinose transferase-like glycosyltransferase
MDNLQWGIPVITLCAAGYFLSWRYHMKENDRTALLLLVACGLILRLFASADFFLHEWDERYHALVARNMMENPLFPALYKNPLLPFDYRDWTSNHIWVHKPPLPLWTMAGSMRIFGVNELALRLPSVLLTTAGIALAFWIGRQLFSRRTGYLTAFFFSINGLIIELTAGRTATDHPDVFFLFFVEAAIALSLLFVHRRKTIFNVAAGLCLGAAVLSKWLPAYIVLPVWVLLVIDSGKFSRKEIVQQFLLLTLTSLLVFLPWQIWIYSRFPVEAAWEAGFNLKHLTTALEGRTGPFYYFFDKIRINYGELIYLPLFWFLWKSFRHPADRNRLAISLWFLIPFLFFSASKTKMQGYILFASPALFLMTAEFFGMLRDRIVPPGLKWLRNLVLILLIALPARYMIERVKPFEQTSRSPEWVSDLKNLRTNAGDSVVLFNYSRPIEAMFYTGFTVYPGIPDSRILTDLSLKGYRVLICDRSNVPAILRSRKEFGLIQLSVPNP